MSAAKHTPGPWRVFNHSWSDTSVLADGFDHAVCLLDINYATEESQDADEAVMAANARLIASAPEFYDWAMRAIARKHRGQVFLDYEDVIDLENIIAKAEVQS
jgi:hypothetical protein